MPITCALTMSFADTGCKDGGGSLKNLYFSEIANKNTITITAGVVTAFTLQSTMKFRTYQLKKEQSSWTDNFTYDPKSGAYVYEPTVDFTVTNLQTVLRQEILLLGQNTLMIMSLDNKGVYRLHGYNNGMDLITATADGGATFADGQKQTLHFVGKEVSPVYEVTSSLIAAIVV